MAHIAPQEDACDPEARCDLPARIPAASVGRLHLRLPDRGRHRRGRPRTRPSGTPSAAPRAASPTAAPATSPATTTTATSRTSRCWPALGVGGVPVLDRLAPGAARPAPARPTPPAWTSTTGWWTCCWTAGIDPVATLFHWDLPQALQDARRLARPGHRRPLRRVRRPDRRPPRRPGPALDHPQRAVRAPDVRARARGARPRRGPPLRRPPGGPPPTARARARRRRAAGPHATAPVAITNNYSPVRLAGATDADRAAGRAYDALHNRLFTDPLLGRGYPAGCRSTSPRCARPATGPRRRPGDDRRADRRARRQLLQPHRRTRARRGRTRRCRSTWCRWTATRGPRSTGRSPPTACTNCWSACATRYGDDLPPIEITESGCAYDDVPDADGRCHDPERIAYLDGHLRAVRAAIDDGVDVRGLLRLVAAGQLGVGRGLHQALRAGARRLRHPGPHAEVLVRLVPRPDRPADPAGDHRVTTIDPPPAALPAALAEPAVPVRRGWIALIFARQPRRLDGLLHPDPGAAAPADRGDRARPARRPAGRWSPASARSPR